MIGMVGRRLTSMAVVLIVGVSIVACRSGEQSTPSPAAPEAIAIATSTSVSATPVPTQTTLPTTTPAPTITPVPTITPALTVTTTPAESSAPSPQQTTVLTITDSQATGLATQGLAANPDALPVPIENPHVTFTQENIKLTADIRGQGSRLEVLGTPEVVDGRVSFKLTSLKLNGFEVPFYRREVGDAINGIFTRMLAGRRVKSVQLGDGTLTVALP